VSNAAQSLLFNKRNRKNEPEWLLQATLKNAYPYNPADERQTSFADFYVFAQRCADASPALISSGSIPRRLRRSVNSGFSGYLAACGEVVH
jgi:hypothetical protein